MTKADLGKYYVERDVSWMYFNHRILQEAEKDNVPILERMSFLGIYSNNLDEFFRVRVASLNRIIEYADSGSKAERNKAIRTLKTINSLNVAYAKEYGCTIKKIRAALKNEKIFIVNEKEVTEKQSAFVRDYYQSQLSGYISPIWFSGIKSFSSSADDVIHLIVRLQKFNEVKRTSVRSYALIELPVGEMGRFVMLPKDGDKVCIMYLDDIIRLCLPYIFQGMEYSSYEAYSFKFTKDAEMEIDTDLRNGLVQKISKGVKSRKRGTPIRVLFDGDMPRDMQKRLMAKLNLDNLDTVLSGIRYQNHKDLMKFPDCGKKNLKYPEWAPVYKKEFNDVGILDSIRKKDRFIHVPYHSFDSYIQLLREAAISKSVKSIKTTLYRLAKDSQVIRALICAAENGKKVTVVIELLARFDEASNIGWSKKMQDAGINVIFGVEGLKVHSKITHIATRTGDVAVISTGNFHEGNASCYTDFMMMTARKPIVSEVSQVFDFILRPYRPVRFSELLVSPNDMRRKFLHLIDEEIRNKRVGKPAYIMCKINHIVDERIVQKLYQASAEGVKIDMLVRGNCSIITGIPGVSDNIHLTGIIDRYLEHSRIFIFCNGGDEKYYIGSADWMTRNFDRRIEVVAPVYEPELKADLKQIVEFGLCDNKQGRIVDGTGGNLPIVSDISTPFRSQEELYKYYQNKEK